VNASGTYWANDLNNDILALGHLSTSGRIANIAGLGISGCCEQRESGEGSGEQGLHNEYA
jgi:hypothetical protein